jgi:hypothetical protein
LWIWIVVTSKTWKWKLGYNTKHQGENVKGFKIRIEHKNIDLLFEHCNIQHILIRSFMVNIWNVYYIHVQRHIKHVQDNCMIYRCMWNKTILIVPHTFKLWMEREGQIMSKHGVLFRHNIGKVFSKLIRKKSFMFNLVTFLWSYDHLKFWESIYFEIKNISLNNIEN